MRDLSYIFGLSDFVLVATSSAMLLVAVGVAHTREVRWTKILAGASVGGAVALAWILTYAISVASFEVVPVAGITFTGPATDTLMAFVTERYMPMTFGVGLVPGVFVGAGVGVLIFREWRLERFGADTPMERYIVGAIFMGFGAMLAGGCAVGSAMSGGAIMSLTAWVAALFIWIGGVTTSLVLTHLEGAQPRVAA
jgi:hypothetical protein